MRQPECSADSERRPLVPHYCLLIRFRTAFRLLSLSRRSSRAELIFDSSFSSAPFRFRRRCALGFRGLISKTCMTTRRRCIQIWWGTSQHTCSTAWVSTADVRISLNHMRPTAKIICRGVTAAGWTKCHHCAKCCQLNLRRGFRGVDTRDGFQQQIVEVSPKGGTLVLFDSVAVPHEVAPTQWRVIGSLCLAISMRISKSRGLGWTSRETGIRFGGGHTTEMTRSRITSAD